MPSQKRTAIINGTPFLFDVGINAGLDLGNTSKLTVEANFDKKTLPNYQGGGGDDDVFYRFKEGTVKLECRHISVDLMLVALGGTAESVAAGVAEETHTVVEVGKLIMLDGMQDMSLPLIVTSADGVTTYDEGVHYTRRRAGIVPKALQAGGIAAGSDVKLSFTQHKHQRVQALVNSITEKGLLFDGINERTGSPWRAKLHRVGFQPTKTLEFIGDDFLNWSLEGQMLAWDGITDPAKSRFYELLVGDL